MNSWDVCRTECFTAGGVETFEVDVRIDGDSIVVAYEQFENPRPVIWKGKQKGEGHFELICREINGRASLHRFPRGGILEGYRKYAENEGPWRIWLK